MGMYRIVGVDGRPYGPVSVEQLRQWVAEGRANAQTQTLAEGATEWKPLGLQPEFAGHFAPPVPLVIGPTATSWRAPKTNASAQAGMILGILSVTLICCCYGFPFNILGLIFSLIGLAQIHEDPQRQQGRGMAITGLILSGISLILAAILVTFGLAMGHYHMMWNIRRY
jgi:Domain of unknown function (DUF4190)/GYF domain 2